MVSDGSITGEYVARFIELHEVELVNALLESFSAEYPDSGSNLMSDSDLRAWSTMELAEFSRVLRGGEPEIRSHDVYEGDTGQKVDELIHPITTFIEGRLFIARTLALYMWRHLDAPVQAKKAAFGLLDAATLRMLRSNIVSFAENELPDGSVMRTWDFSPNGARARKRVPARSEAKADSGKPALTYREREIALLVAAGRTNGEIAAQLGLAQSTVKNRLVRIFDKLGVNTRAELASWMAREDQRA